jgi:hypothetical protein
VAAQAEIALPGCAALTAFAGEVDLRERQVLNPMTTLGFASAFLGDDFAGLYGKTAMAFSVEDAAAARQEAKDCAKQAGSRDEKKLLAALEKQFARGVGPVVEKMAKAEVALAAGLEAFAAAPAGRDKLSVIAGLRALVDWDRDAYQAAVRRISRDFRKLADGIVGPLRDLPTAAVAERALPAVEPLYAASRDAVLAEVSGEIAAIEASEAGLRRFDRDAAKILEPLDAILPADARTGLEAEVAARKAAIEGELIAANLAQLETLPPRVASLQQVEQAAGRGLVQVLSPQAAEGYLEALRARRQALALAVVEAVPADLNGLLALPQLREPLQGPPGGLAGDTERTAIDAAITAKQETLGAAIAQELLTAIAAVPVESRGFKALDGMGNPQILRLLAAGDAEAVRTAAEARREAIAAEAYPQLEAELAALDESEQSLAVIDTVWLPDIQAWPASAEAQRTRFLSAVVERRNAILAALTEAELGPLSGRAYADRGGSTRLEFEDDGRVFVSSAGSQTIVASYEEEDDTRVLVTLPQGTVVFTREGRWLVGGPVQLRRVDQQP